MTKYIDKDALVAEIERRLDKLANTSAENNREFSAIIGAQHYELISLAQYINTLEVKEINTWHLQKNENIYDAVKDWSLYSFVCLMDDGSIQKFTGMRDECADGSINIHIDAIDDKYDTDNIIFWIETPL